METTVDLWGLVVNDACSEVDDDQGVLNVWDAVDDSFGNFGLDVLEVVL